LPKSEINSLNEQIDEDHDEIDLAADPLHSRPRAIGCILPKYVRHQLGFPVSQKEMDTAFSIDFTEVYKRDYGSPNVLHFGKKPLQWCKKLVFTDTDTSCHTVIRTGDFIQYKDFATRANRIGKVDGIFVHQLLETRRLFCYISEAEFASNERVSARDPVLDLPILRLTGSKSLIGLPRIGSRNLYVIDVDDTLVLVNWIDVHFL